MSSSEAAEYNIQNVPSKPPIPKPRRSIKEEKSLNNNIQSLHMERKRSEKSNQQNTSNHLSKTEESSREQSTNDIQMTESSSEENEETQDLQDRSRTTSPERNILRNLRSKEESPESKCSIRNKFCFFFLILSIGFMVLFLNKNEVQTQSLNDPTLFELIKSIKETFHNQESDIWNDISSAINEVISRTPKIPSIILLFAKETTTMECLAKKLADASKTVLHADKPLEFNPKDFGNDAGEIITILKKYPPEKKKVVMIHDILNINTEAIKALHNLCDRINPLVAEAIYILTMQTNNYQSPQKKLQFVEKQIYNKLSKSIDQDVLMALVTRITDGAIIWVQSEPSLKYC